MESTPEEKLRERLGDSCDAAIGRKIAEFGGLLSRNAAAALLCRENGIDLERKVRLSEARSMPLPFSFSAKVDRIFPLQAYNGSKNRSVRLHVSDEGGEATLILWNEQANAVKGEVSIGDIIECRGAYFKGGEIGIGRSGSIRKEKGFPITRISRLAYGLCSVEGVVKLVEPDHFYIDRKTGEGRRLSAFSLCDDGACVRVAVWPPQPGGQKASAGDVLLLENVFYRNGELHFDAFSRLVKRKAAGERFGKFEGAAIDGDLAVFSIEGEKYSVGIGEALALLGIKSVPDGVSPQALAMMKSRGMEGRAVKYFAEGAKLTLIEVE